MVKILANQYLPTIYSKIVIFSYLTRRHSSDQEVPPTEHVVSERVPVRELAQPVRDHGHLRLHHDAWDAPPAGLRKHDLGLVKRDLR